MWIRPCCTTLTPVLSSSRQDSESAKSCLGHTHLNPTEGTASCELERNAYETYEVCLLQGSFWLGSFFVSAGIDARGRNQSFRVLFFPQPLPEAQLCSAVQLKALRVGRFLSTLHST